MVSFLLALQVFLSTPAQQREPETLLSGIWTSCPDDSPEGYSERQTEFYAKNGSGWFTLDLGPREEFAVFAGTFPQHIAHDDAANLLKPAYHYGDVATATGRNWSIASLGIHLNVVAMNQNENGCYAFLLLAERLTRPRWAKQ